MQQKVRRKYHPEDDFFYLGNLERENKWRHVDVEYNDSMLEEEWISCNVAGCQKDFETRLEYENHYQMVHRNACNSCSATFPNFHLLDLHVSERHDSFFQAMATRQPMYKCLESICSSIFSSDKERLIHLQQAHCYSPQFRFHQAKKKKRCSGRSKSKPKKKTNAPTAVEDHLDQEMQQLRISFGGRGRGGRRRSRKGRG